jgi:hypothetical protein
MKTENDFGGEVKREFNWSIPVIAIFAIIAIVLFAPIKVKRTFTHTTQVRMIDAVLVEFQWTAEYHTPLIISDDKRDFYEFGVQNVVTNEICKTVRTYLNSADLYVTNIDSIQRAIYGNSEIRGIQPALDTVLITKVDYEERFLIAIREAFEIRKRQAQEEADAIAKKAFAQQKAITKKYEAVLSRQKAIENSK